MCLCILVYITPVVFHSIFRVNFNKLFAQQGEEDFPIDIQHTVYTSRPLWKLFRNTLQTFLQDFWSSSVNISGVNDVFNAISFQEVQTHTISMVS